MDLRENTTTIYLTKKEIREIAKLVQLKIEDVDYDMGIILELDRETTQEEDFIYNRLKSERLLLEKIKEKLKGE